MNGLAYSGIPLGGIGTGTVEFRADGLFHEWQIMNNMPWAAGPAVETPADSAFFGLQVKESGSKGEGRSVLLCEPKPYNSWLNDPYDLAFIEYPALKASAKFPFTKLAYKFAKDFPVEVSSEAFSPFIPLDYANSALPAGLFNFKVKNRSTKEQTVSLMMAARNFSGYTVRENESKMRFAQNGTASVLTMARDGVKPTANDAGEMAIAFHCAAPHEASYEIHPMNSRSLWEPLRDSGKLENRDLTGTFAKGGNIGDEWLARNSKDFAMGAICLTATLKPGETIAPLFLLGWFFPNFHDREYTCKGVPASPIGCYYANKFHSVEEVVDYALKNAGSLKRRSAAFSSAFFASDLPEWLLDAFSAQLTTLRKSAWRDKAGNFGVWEGLGCCGLQTTDVSFYASYPIVQLFPELELSQMRLTVKNIAKPGKIPHMMPGNFSCCDKDERERIDLVPQFITMVWRDHLWLDDLAFVKEMLPVIKQAFEFYKVYDKDGDGLPNNCGPDQTYDQLPLKGTSASVGFEFAGSLLAAADLAKAAGETELAKTWSEEGRKALAKLDEQLWNGSFYRLSYDPIAKCANEGVMVDQLVGDWFMRQADGKGIVPTAKAIASAKAVFKTCLQPQGYLANCAWENGEKTKIGRHTANQADWPWSGTEFAFAAQLALLGLHKESTELCEKIFQRHEGRGLRFNHIECGQHYYRAMSSWAAYLAFTGFSMDRPARALEFNLAAGLKKFIFCDAASWGEVEMTASGMKLTVKDGVLELKKISVKNSPFKTLSAIGQDAKFEEGAIVFGKQLVLKRGESLELKA